MHRRVALLTPLAALLLAAAPARAQDPAAQPAPPAPAPAAPAPPATGTLSIGLEKVNGGDKAVMSGTRFRVRGAVTPYVPGQTVTVRLYHGTRKLAARKVTVRPIGARGGFVLGVDAREVGTLTVTASHRATPELATLVAEPRKLRSLSPNLDPGAQGLAVRLLQRQLEDLGYVTGTRGTYDARTARAVVAFRKVTGMARVETAGAEVFRALAAGKGRYVLRFPKHGKHVEADIARQVIVLADKGKVLRIYPTSSGAPATPTVLGSFKVYLRTPGTNAKGMVYSSYFIRGYAIHGYAQVPVFNASHGCLRVPVPDAISIYDWLDYGDIVDVYQ